MTLLLSYEVASNLPPLCHDDMHHAERRKAFFVATWVWQQLIGSLGSHAIRIAPVGAKKLKFSFMKG
jgi:hypothetical protein